MNPYAQATLVFAAVAVLDLAWARYTIALTDRRGLVSGLYAAGIIALSGFAAVNYVGNPWMLLPAMAGAFVGTVTAVRWR